MRQGAGCAGSPDTSVRYKYRTRPHPHQVRALRKLLRNRGGGMQVPMRYGKTKIDIDFAGCLHVMGLVRKVLVVTTTDGIAVWHNEIAKHCAVPYAIDSIDGPRWPEFPGPNDSPDGTFIEWRVINWENTYAREFTGRGREWVPVPRADLTEYDADLFVADESHYAGNPTAVISKEAYRLARKARHVVIQTGTMFHRKPFYVFGQVKLYDPFIFGTNWGHFKNRIAVMGGYGGYEVKRYKNLKWMTKKLEPWVHMEERVPTMPPVINVIPAPLTGRNLEVYKKMEREAIVKLSDGSKATADIILTKHMRLQQIAGGHLRTDQGYRKVGRCKIDIASARLTQYLEQDITKAVVGARFIPELVDLAKTAKRIGFRPILFHGGVPKGPKRTARIADFQETDDEVLFIAQIRAAAEAIDLSATSTMMFYSLEESFVKHDQFAARIDVFGDPDRTLMYDFIVAPGTRDEVSYEAMKEKQDVATYIATDPERVERIVAANVERKDRKKGRE